MLIGLSVILCLLILIALFIYFIIDSPYKSKITTTAEITTTEITTTENTTTVTTTTVTTTTEEQEDELVLDLENLPEEV